MEIKNIFTERLILMPFTYNIAKALAAGSVKEVEELGLKTNGKWPRQDTMDVLPFIIKDFERNGQPTGFEGWMMVLKENKTIIGDIGFKGTPDENGDVEIGYGIIEDEHGKGYGFEALKAMIDWAFSQDRVKTVKADCLINNAPSIRILEKVGMRELKRDCKSIYWEIGEKNMGKILCFVYDNMADFEITLACDMISRYVEKEVISVGYEKAPVKAISKIQYMPEMTIKEAMNLEDVEGLIIPGGTVRECRAELIELIQKLHGDKKLICAICAAPEFLAKAGILDDHSYTTVLSEKYFEENGIKDCFPRQNYLEQKVVRHENIITAKGRSFVDFGVEIMDYFNIFEEASDKAMCARDFKGE